MKKTYTVEFTYNTGAKEKVVFETDNIKWSMEQWMRNRTVINNQIIDENSANSKQMLFG
jgi:hypothetical protein